MQSFSADRRPLGLGNAGQRHRSVSLMSPAADDADLPPGPEFRPALLACVAWATRLSMTSWQPGAEVVEQAPVPRWGRGVPPPWTG